MPAQERSHRRDHALLWAITGRNDAHGQPIVSLTSQELQVQWNDKQSEALDPQGNTVTVDATVVVGQDVSIGGLMWHGSLVDLTNALPGTSDATNLDIPLSGLYQVRTFNSTKDLKGRVARRTAGLMRFKDAMPEQA